MTGCRIRLLGGWHVSLEGEDVTSAIPGGRARLLIAYLTLATDAPPARKRIAFDFWPDSTEKQALTNLRKLLHDLRAKWPAMERCLLADDDCVRWNTALPIDSDVREFERLAHSASVRDLLAAERMYRGELLPGQDEEWLDGRRQSLARLYADVLEKLIAALEGRREYADAERFASKLLRHQPFKEEAYRALMRLQALDRDYAGVERTYRQLCSVWADELGIAPAEETVRLYDKLVALRHGDAPAASGDEPPLIGRYEPWERMRQAWKRVATDGSAMLVVRGEAGIGKTRLALELRTLAERQGDAAACACCYASAKALAYTPVAAWLRSFPVPELGAQWLSELARLLPELNDRFPDLPAPEPLRDSWQLARWYEAIERMLRSRQPLLLVLDDIQWCDDETLRLLAYLLRSAASPGLLVVATLRTDEYAGDSVERLLAELRSERKLATVDLGGLGAEDTRRLLAATAGDALADRHSAAWHAETGGNPLFLLESIREWRSREAEGGYEPPPVMQSVLDNRLGRLTPVHRRLVDCMAVLDRPAPSAWLAAWTDAEEEATLDRIEQLARMNVLRDAGGGLYDFAHHRLKEAAYRLLGDGSRRKWHRRIADGLVALFGDRTDALAGDIAQHYELAGLRPEAAHYYAIAAEAAERLYANETAIRLYRKLIALLPPERVLPILVRLGDILIVAGRWSEAEQVLREWLDRPDGAAALRERARCEAALGNCLRLQGKYAEAGACLERARRRFELTGDADGLSAVYVTLGLLHYYRGDSDKALDVLNRRSGLSDSGRRARDDCRAFGILGHLYYDRCEYDRAAHWVRRQIGLAESIGDRYTVQQALGLLAMIDMDTDEMNRAREHLDDKLRIGASIGDRMGVAVVYGMLGRHYGLLGRYEQADACIVYCLEEALAIRDWRVAAIMLSYGGRFLAERRRHDEAEQWLARSRDWFDRLQTPYFACETLHGMSLLLSSRGQHEQAIAVAEQAMGMAERLRRQDMRIRLRIGLSQWKLRLGRIGADEAVRELRLALDDSARPQDRAAVQFALWQTDPCAPGLRDDALRLNEALYRQSGKAEYAQRCRLLAGSADMLPPAPPESRDDADKLPDRRVSPAVLELVDRHLPMLSAGVADNQFAAT